MPPAPEHGSKLPLILGWLVCLLSAVFLSSPVPLMPDIMSYWPVMFTLVAFFPVSTGAWAPRIDQIASWILHTVGYSFEL